MIIENIGRIEFTFYYIYIKTYSCELIASTFFDLHSTIFILKRENIQLKKQIDLNLHSTIFILKHFLILILYLLLFLFTFYYIYIKTVFLC